MDQTNHEGMTFPLFPVTDIFGLSKSKLSIQVGTGFQ